MMNGMNMGKIMKQAQEMQKKMAAEQGEIENQDFTGVSPEEMVTVTFGGNRKMKDMQVKPEAIDPDDPDMLSDLVISAVNDALAKIEETTQNKMGKYTKGMNIPGM
ncbi:YbaB/EbfC family nucleoid-associated protein [Fructilactobacillus lindneri]|nr:YbaB/EbfC family nucleoid-associated protein [Fructilactobacillus lindneri]POG98409.1 YbaB/EbfC family nucleoid-associated protein [Fructilactobacillus lindneri]POH03808.1 YbaB/EbfC family nucleoid-associated protein [Fructilactobacillus lindneri]POH04948.1 YbaB/EbfC family nucleoid-associated protein [Fructilactobacillus lindneri]POH05512.1 YbaB/EbfC family nucleoid-associated protein [Fructilactobacillus lindneri]POH07949.1 YbaB/EbfC family nucleoid-associated protein [Fructilactobacillus